MQFRLVLIAESVIITVELLHVTANHLLLTVELLRVTLELLPITVKSVVNITSIDITVESQLLISLCQLLTGKSLLITVK